MIGEKKKWFKILTWEKYQELKDKPLEFENELSNLRTENKIQNENISKLEFELIEVKNEKEKFLWENIKLKNQLEAQYDKISSIKKAHAEEKSELRKKINDLKNKSKVKK